MEEEDDFAIAAPAVEVTATNPLAKIEIASSAGQVKDTTLRSAEEHERSLLYFVGDLPEGLEREQRAAQEKCWTVEKRFLAEYYLPPPPPMPDGVSGLLVTATNGIACYAFHGPQTSLYDYYRACAVLERQSARAAWLWRIRSIQIASQAKVLRSYMLAVAQKDAQLADVANECVKRLEALMPGLPETLADVAPPTPTARPGTKSPELTLSHVPLTRAETLSCGDENDPGLWTIWSCSTSNPKQRWTASRCRPLRTHGRTIPCMAVSKTHMAVLWQPPTQKAFQLRLITLSDMGRPSARAGTSQDWRVELTADAVAHFVEGEGLLTMSLSDDGVCCVACSNAVWIARLTANPAANSAANPAEASIIVIHAGDVKRNITCARHMPGTSIVMLGTAFGECYEVNYASPSEGDGSGLVRNVEHILACEPLYDAYISNRRTLMQSVLAMSGRLIPYHSEDFFFLPSGRVLASAVCGTLVFALEKYGSILVHSAVMRDTISPFAEPAQEFYNAQGMSETLVAYRGIHASSERVVAVYPNGLVRVIQIKPKAARKITIEAEAAMVSRRKRAAAAGGKKKK